MNEVTLKDILENDSYAQSYKNDVVAYALIKRKIDPDEVESYLKDMSANSGNTTEYRKLLCAYDYVKYSERVD